MNTEKLRTKRVVIPAIATAAVLAVGGTVWAASANDGLGGSERDRVAAAAVKAVGDGTATDVETSDDRGEAYEVEVRRDHGSEVEVTLDKDLQVIGQHRDDDGSRDDDRDGGQDGDRADREDTPDRIPTAAERAWATKAALAAVGGGTVAKVETSHDGPEAYEVTVLDQDQTLWDVELDAAFKVLSKELDD